MATLVKCTLGPRLYRIYRRGEVAGHEYEANALERHSDTVVKWVNVMWNLTWYFSPGVGFFLYRRGYFTVDGLISIARFAGTVFIILFSAVCVRGIGRVTNEEYRKFLKILHEAQKNKSLESRRSLAQYDFQFKAWPVDFRWDEVESDERKPIVTRQVKQKKLIDRVKGLPCQVVSYILVHTFGRRLIYPGSVSVLSAAVGPMLLQGRTKQVEEYNGQRAKLLARDGNSIDTMFIDRRNKEEQFSNGNTLVVCCEGNAGFYEIGCTCTPVEGGYSVLGWNHPGFAGSTGVPFPESEANAVDVVMQYAINKLGFQVENIIIFAWSIGGFTASLAAKNYPDVRAVILDATFDDLVPLAVARMPDSLRGVIIRGIRDYVNLNIADQLSQYSGPLRLIRRTRDEIITTDEHDVASNRGNDLLVKVLKQRYPKLITNESLSVLKAWLSASDQITQLSILSSVEVDESECFQILQSYAEENSASFPMLIGDDLEDDTKMKLLLFLATKYLSDFDSTHCTPLPASQFAMPWMLDEEFVIYDGQDEDQ
ncbi:phosphatidylserine lipase ABHD16A-like [Ptychodera flava]|uniref:phosphatidylserine lipase ABHD16A-like n=1 Tax=Ptychodera flava TaxID=63121 RepID=UPI00396A1DEA